VPLGRRSQWLCHTCGRPPQAIFRLPAAVLALVGFGLAAYATAMMFTDDSTGEDIYYVWEGRLLFGGTLDRATPQRCQGCGVARGEPEA
jgi:hypothetical protein